MQGRPKARVELRLRRPLDGDPSGGPARPPHPRPAAEWDSANMKFKNAPELDAFVHTEYRKGWSL